ncbi:lipopolysaccharide phosphoethanolamine transferase [Proteus hauseri ATCC 700826]|uniref:Lipopolysaccharide phosphoethanolamine transferase n=1 Tax=Proteus hauseri ATCC 700826 TaxID=1354271 RepID=A0AAJ3HU23_PROHU|nr:kdo(2)-lipid A phosphoethanolamine 7''-transferase [Proteus hauseri]OAT49071.1 lipopolysaccharide phosphoethanolamine transferase [Proteus hauseri ATCC 700826]
MQKLKFLRFSKENIALFLAIYIGFFLNLSVYIGRFGTQNTHNIIIDSLYLLGEIAVNIAFTFFLLRLLSFFGTLFFKIIASFILIVSVCASYYISFFDVVIGYGIIISTLTTDIDLSKEVISLNTMLWIAGLSILPLVVIWLCKKPDPNLTNTQKKKIWIKNTITMVVIALAVFAYLKTLDSRQKAYEIRNNLDLPSYSGGLSYAFLPTNWIIPLFQYGITRYDDTFNNQQLFNPADHFTYQPSKVNDDVYVVFIIGETARWDHMGLLGYERETNPLLTQEKNLVAFRGISCDTATKLSLKCMFVRENGTDDNDQRTLKENNIFSILRQLGMTSELYSMQSELWFYNKLDLNNYAMKEMMTAKNSNFGKELDDTLLIAETANSVAHYPKGNHLVILHTKGSHFMYSQRYPESFKKYQPECLNVDDECTKEQLVNAYDNSILYTDYFIDGVLDTLRDKKAIVFYTSDHGESISENGGLHGTPKEIAPEEQFKVPFLVWMSDSYLAEPENKKLFDNLKRNQEQERVFYHHNIFDSMLGCLGYTSTDGGINNKNNLCFGDTPSAKE